MWRCPHCGTPQAETARCWVCRRSTTACSTCRHFRQSVAAHLGYCGLDPRRLPLLGDEIRPCWEAASAVRDHVPATADGARAGVGATTLIDAPEHRTFVELEPAEFIVPPADERWSLWGDAET